MMDIGRSVRVMLARDNKKAGYLREQLSCSATYASKIRNQEIQGIGTIIKLAAIFNVKVSEFIRAGE